MSIKEIDLASIEHDLGEGAAELVKRFICNLEPAELQREHVEEKAGSLIQRRSRILREISVRRGQRKYRSRLIRRYGPFCQVTGCSFVQIIEAAHIDPYSESENNGVGNGLLLRSDIHTLFDLGYIGIEPLTLKVQLHPSLKGSEYVKFEGMKLRIKNTNGPEETSLHSRWSFFKGRSDKSTGHREVGH